MASRANFTPLLLEGMADTLGRLDEVARRSTNLKDVWPVLGQMYANRQRVVFATNGLGRWEPLKPNTVLYGDARPLVKTGVMREGLTRLQPRFAGKRFVAYGPEKYDRSVMNPAVLHAAGTRSMPRRVPVPPLRAAEKRAWIGAVAKYVFRVVQSA